MTQFRLEVTKRLKSVNDQLSQIDQLLSDKDQCKFLNETYNDQWVACASDKPISGKALHIHNEGNSAETVQSASFKIGVAVSGQEAFHKICYVRGDQMSNTVKRDLVKGERVNFTPGKTEQEEIKTQAVKKR